MIAVRAGDVASPARRGLGKDGRTALAVRGAPAIRTGDVVVFCKPVAIAPAVVRRDGRIQAAGHPADHVRLGVAEERLDALCGRTGVIDEVARTAMLAGKVKGVARRAMTAALAIRFILLMALMLACYAEVMAALAGDLADVPWQRPWVLPADPVISTWRAAVGAGPLERLRDMVLAGTDAEYRARDYRAISVGGLEVCAIDGTLIRVPDTPANRAAYGSAGTADDSSPWPQMRDLWLDDASTRGMLGVVSGPAGASAAQDKGEAEQVLLDRAVKDYPHLFTPGRLWILDRNFPGVPRIARLRLLPRRLRWHRAPVGCVLRQRGRHPPVCVSWA